MTAPIKLREATAWCWPPIMPASSRNFRSCSSRSGSSSISAGELGLPEPDETGTTFAENARIKAHAAAKGLRHAWRSADDSGLCVDALGGDPGVYTANWAGPQPRFQPRHETRRGCAAGRQCHHARQRRGSFNATLCLAHPDGRDWLFEGKVDGTLVWPPRGDIGFGFDPVFMPDGYDITFGQMPSRNEASLGAGPDGLVAIAPGPSPNSWRVPD